MSSAEEVARILNGTGRASADVEHGTKSTDCADWPTICTDEWNVADTVLSSVPRRGIPVTILTGFLGAGKTTVLNYLLQQEHGLRMAVLVNEFGEVDIDSQIVQSGNLENDDMVLLKNGCICCTISNSFVESVQRVLEVREGERPNYLVIETSGIADPGPIITNLEETELDETLYLDQVLTVVDAYNFHAEEMQSTAAQSQIRNSDTVLLSKTDLVADSGHVTQVVGELREMRPGVRIVLSRRGEIPVAELFDVGMHLQRRLPQTPSSSAPAATESPRPDGQKTPRAESLHLTLDQFESTSFLSTRPFRLKDFRTKFLKNLPPTIYRSKGLLWFDAYPMRFVFQLSGRRFQIEQDEWPPGLPRSNQLVIIGRDLDKLLLRQCLESCLLPEDADLAADHTIVAAGSVKRPP